MRKQLKKSPRFLTAVDHAAGIPYTASVTPFGIEVCPFGKRQSVLVGYGAIYQLGARMEADSERSRFPVKRGGF